MAAGRLRCDPRNSRKLIGSQGTSVHQFDEHCRSGRHPDEQSDLCNLVCIHC